MNPLNIDVESLSFKEREKLKEIIKSPLEWAKAFLIEPNMMKPFVPNYVQSQILGTSGMQNVVCVYRRAGKCLCGETSVIDPETLVPTPLKALKKAKVAQSYNFSRSEWGWQPVKQFHENGMKPCLRLEFESGTHLECTENHELWVLGRGWVRADHLRAGDLVGAPGKIEVYGTLSLPNQELASLVKAIGDQRVETPLKRLSQWSRQRAKTRDLPSFVFRFTKECLSRFLSLLFQSYGHYLHEPEGLSLTLLSYKAALSCRHLFLRLGVPLSLRKVGQKYVLSTLDEMTVLRAFYEMGFPIAKPEAPSSLRGERLKSIDPCGLKMTYDLGIDHADHNYLAADLLVHNSWSMIILALWAALTNFNHKILILAPNGKQVQNIFNEMQNFVNINPWIADQLEQSSWSSFRLKFNNGASIQGFIAGSANKKGSESVVGQTADMFIVDEADLLNEADWMAIKPIMAGDAWRMGKVRTYLTSTIRKYDSQYTKLLFYDAARDIAPTQESEVNIMPWQKVYIPIDKDPSKTEAERLHLWGTVLDKPTWEREYLCVLPNADDKRVFNKDQVDWMFSHDYTYGSDLVQQGLVTRFMGVDWDKVQAGPTISIVQFNHQTRLSQIIHHEEIPKGDFALTTAVQRVLDLDKEYQVQRLLVDRGYGDFQVEYLKQHCLDSGPRGYERGEKVEGIAFQSNFHMYDPITGEEGKKQFKQLMVNILQFTMQEHLLIGSRYDRQLAGQFGNFAYKSRTLGNVTFVSDNEHGVDSVGLAVFGIYRAFLEGMRAEIATRTIRVEAPKVIESAQTQQERLARYSQMSPWREERGAGGFSRGFIQGTKRSRF